MKIVWTAFPPQINIYSSHEYLLMRPCRASYHGRQSYNLFSIDATDRVTIEVFSYFFFGSTHVIVEIFQ